jgi:general secretion pathway protein D
MVFLRPMIIRNQEDSNALSMDRYDLIRSAQQGVGQPRQSLIMPINNAPVAPVAPTLTPGSPFRNGTVPPPLSWPETVPAAPGTTPPAPPATPARAAPPAAPARVVEMP